MPSLDLISAGNSSSTLIQVVQSAPVVEPLDGPNIIDNLMDRFPEQVYHQGRDTHLYRLLTALCGDAGAGLVKRQVFATRLQFEAEFINYAAIDQFYTQTFGLSRLPSETYSVDPSTQVLTPAQTDAINLADAAFYLRAVEFFTATRYGTTPTAMALLARAGSDIDSDIFEHYKYIFDQYSDMPQGRAAHGQTISLSEFVVAPRFDATNTGSQYVKSWAWSYVFTAPVLASGAGRPVAVPVGPNVFSVARTFANTPVTSLVPAVERNMVDLYDRLRPQGTAFTVTPGSTRYSAITLQSPPVASSERLLLSRFVTGDTGVSWPAVDSSSGFFIESGIEIEATSWHSSARELPIIFQTVENTWAYTEAALGDPKYNTGDFYAKVNHIAPIDSYLTEHIGIFSATLTAIFPALGAVSPDVQFAPADAIATQDTPLILEGKALGK